MYQCDRDLSELIWDGGGEQRARVNNPSPINYN